MLLVSVAGQRSPLCGNWQDCRRLALEAREQGDFDRFHDLAWAALQVGPKNDRDLMYLVARAQALSGRPHNALVMLQRLTDAGLATDADTDPDFEQPRLLPDWPQVAAAIASVRAAPSASAPAIRPAAGTSTASTAAPAAVARPVVPPATVTPAAASPAPAVPAASTAAVPLTTVPAPATDAGSFSTASTGPFVSAGLAYDVVSRRFVVGDTLGHKLLVVGAGATHSDDLLRIESVGFGDLAALGIDEQRGNLWVAGASSTGESGLQRLQLVSGRALRSYRPQASAGPTRLADLAILGSGDVIALDSTGSRLLALANGGMELTVVAPLKLSGVTSLARRDDNVVYVAHDAGIARFDLRTRAVTTVSAPKGVELGRFETIRLHRDALIGVQVTADGVRTLIRLALNRAGGAVTGAAMLDAPFSGADRRLAVAISGDNLYYLADDSLDSQPSPASNPSTPRAPLVIRQIALPAPSR